MDNRDTGEANVKSYVDLWDLIANQGKLDLIDTHFAPDYTFASGQSFEQFRGIQ